MSAVVPGLAGFLHRPVAACVVPAEIVFKGLGCSMFAAIKQKQRDKQRGGARRNGQTILGGVSGGVTKRVGEGRG